jgi:hypothetical protein
MGSATAQTICSGSTTNIALNSTVIGHSVHGWQPQTAPTAAITGFSNGTQNTVSLSNTRTTAGIRYTVLQILVQEHLLQLMLPLI